MVFPMDPVEWTLQESGQSLPLSGRSPGENWVAKVMDIDTPMDSQNDDPWNPCIFGFHM